MAKKLSPKQLERQEWAEKFLAAWREGYAECQQMTEQVMGSCNFDHPVIQAGWREVKLVNELAGKEVLHSKRHSRFWRGFAEVSFPGAMGGLGTARAELMKKRLEEAGFRASVFYAVD